MMKMTERQRYEWMECRRILGDVDPELGAGFVPFYPPDEDEVPVEPVRDALEKLGREAENLAAVSAWADPKEWAEAIWLVATGFAHLAELLEARAASSEEEG